MLNVIPTQIQALTLNLAIARGGQPAFSSVTYKGLIYGGGFVDGAVYANDGSLYCRVDSGAAYYWNGSAWVNRITQSGIPAGLVSFTTNGVYEIAPAPSSGAIVHMVYGGAFLHSSDHGGTWTQATTGPTGIAYDINDPNRPAGPHMAVDPFNTSNAICGTPAAGAYQTTNGGVTWTQISTSSIPISSAGPGGAQGIMIVCADPSTSGVWYVFSYGHGWYKTTGGPTGTWAIINTTGMPTASVCACCSLDGYLYTGDNSNSNLTIYHSGAWSTSGSTAFAPCSVAADPGTTGRVVITSNGGGYNVSLNHGTAFSGYTSAQSLTATDVPWLATTANTFLSAGRIVFNPAGSNSMLLSAGVGCWVTSPNSTSSGATAAWTSQTVGINNNNSFQIISPTGINPILGSWDRPYFPVYPVPGPGQLYVPNTGGTVENGSSIDWAKSQPNVLIGTAYLFGGAQDNSGFSTDGGQTWETFGQNTAATASWALGATTISIPSGLPVFAGATVTDEDNNGAAPTTTAAWTTSSTSISIPSGVTGIVVGQKIFDLTTGQNLIGTVSSYSGTTLHLTAAALAASSGSTDQLFISSQGQTVGTVSSYTGTTLTLTAGALVPSNGSGDPLLITSLPTTSQAVYGYVAASTATNWLLVPFDGGGNTFFTTNGNTWAASTITGVSSAGHGWRGGETGLSKYACAEVGGVFYLYNQGGTGATAGVYKSTNGGSTFANVFSGALSGASDNGQMQCVPGQPNNLFFAGGSIGGEGFLHSTDGGVTWPALSGVTNVYAFGFGAAYPGKSFPTVYISGSVSGVYGLYRNIDVLGSGTWQLLATYPQGAFYKPTSISGDNSAFGWYYVGFQLFGYLYGVSNDAAPWGTFTAPAQNATVSGTISLTVTIAADVNCTSVQFQIDGTNTGAPVTPLAGGATLSFNTSGLASGAHTFIAILTGDGQTTTIQCYVTK